MPLIGTYIFKGIQKAYKRPFKPRGKCLLNQRHFNLLKVIFYRFQRKLPSGGKNPLFIEASFAGTQNYKLFAFCMPFVCLWISAVYSLPVNYAIRWSSSWILTRAPPDIDLPPNHSTLSRSIGSLIGSTKFPKS